MSQNSTKVDTLLARKQGHLGRLIQKSRYLSHLDQSLKALLEPPLDQHCAVANFEQGVLTIFADSAVWASRLRYLSTELLFQLQRRGDYASSARHIKSIECKVKPLPPLVREAHLPPARRLSPDTVHLLEDYAEGIEDEALREALLKLKRWENK